MYTVAPTVVCFSIIIIIVGGASNPRKFSPRFFPPPIREVFSLESFPLYGECVRVY